MVSVDAKDIKSLVHAPYLKYTRWKVWILCALSMLLAGFVSVMMDVMVLARYIQNMGLGKIHLHEVMQFSYLGIFVGSLAFGLLADVWGRRKTLLLAWGVLVLTFVLMLSTKLSFTQLKVVFMAERMTWIGILMVGLVLSMEYSHKWPHVRSMFLLGAYVLGMALAHFMVLEPLGMLDVRSWVFVLAVSGAVLLLLLGLALPESLYWLLQKNQTADQVRIALVKIHVGFVSTNVAALQPPSTGKLPQWDWKPWFKTILLYSMMLGLVLFVLNGMRDYVSRAAMKMTKSYFLMEKVNGILSFADTVMALLGIALAGILLQCLGRTRAMLFFCALCASSVVYLSRLPVDLQASGVIWALAGVAISLGALLWWMKAAIVLMSSHHRCSAFAMSGIVGTLLAAVLLKSVYDLQIRGELPLLYYVIPLVALASLFWFTRKQQEML